MNKSIGPDLYRCSKCNDLTGMRDEPCGRCAMSQPVPQPTTITKCALCNLAFMSRPDGFVDEDIEREAADHHAVCPKRPIEVGDYVRLDIIGAQFVGAWQEGTVEGVDSLGYAAVRLQNAGPEMASEIGNVRRLWVKSLRRIPRPAAAAPTCTPGCQCGAHGPDTTKITQDDHSALVLVDGITREECHMRWSENRLIVEGGPAFRCDAPHDLTPDQITAAKEVHAAGSGARDSAELRAKVDAGREAERSRMRVDIQDIDP